MNLSLFPAEDLLSELDKIESEVARLKELCILSPTGEDIGSQYVLRRVRGLFSEMETVK
jgi:hypothetical protein